MDSITFDVPGKPQGKGRPRFTRNGHIYTPAETVGYERLIRDCYVLHKGGCFEDKAVGVSIVAAVQPPKYFTKKKFTEAINGTLRPQTKPDLDNIVKAVLDALNGIAYSDDKNVVKVTAEKLFSSEEKLIITIWEVK